MSIEHSLLLLVLIIAAAKIAGELAEYLGQPAVLGEMLAGVILTFTMLRHAPDDHALMFIGTIGIILLLFEVGLESELDEFVKVGKSATLVAVTGVVLPLAAGFAVSFSLLGDTRYALFLGATLTATSVGITARVLSDMRRTNSRESRIILGAAVIDDILGLLALSIVLGITTTGSINLPAVGKALLVAVVFLVTAIWVGIRYANVLVPLAQHLRTRGVLVSVSFLFCITLALIAEELGLAAIIGAFAAGLVLASTDDKVKIQKQIKPLADIFIPVFFVLVGLQVNLGAMNPLEAGGRQVLLVGLILLVVAVVTKLVSGFGVIDKGTSKLAVGIGMVPRGEVGLIFASIGLQQKIIPEGLYSALVLIVFASTLVTPPFLKWAFRKVESVDDQTDVEESGEAVVSGEQVGVPEQLQTSACPFCEPETLSKAIAQMGSVFAILDINPVSTGHMLIIPRRHVADFFDMTQQEWCDATALLHEMRQRITSQDPTIEGFNVGVNCGKVAGQTVMHTHIHLIPRRQEDTPHPRGGVRGVIPEKMNY